ncbi:MAG TPA: helix-turn-helix transcriptional regulator [Solirubrobacteraceae bacterium]|nr:helix-turn-helix transcriptional regulator [Solirubrobacteraceae bacterium]
MAAKKSDLNKALGTAMRSARKERGYSQEAFARRAGLDRSNYGAIERGEANITVDTLAKVAGALGLRVSELFARAGR